MSLIEHEVVRRLGCGRSLAFGLLGWTVVVHLKFSVVVS